MMVVCFGENCALKQGFLTWACGWALGLGVKVASKFLESDAQCVCVFLERRSLSFICSSKVCDSLFERVARKRARKLRLN